MTPLIVDFKTAEMASTALTILPPDLLGIRATPSREIGIAALVGGSRRP